MMNDDDLNITATIKLINLHALNTLSYNKFKKRARINTSKNTLIAFAININDGNELCNKTASSTLKYKNYKTKDYKTKERNSC